MQENITLNSSVPPCIPGTVKQVTHYWKRLNVLGTVIIHQIYQAIKSCDNSLFMTNPVMRSENGKNSSIHLTWIVTRKRKTRSGLTHSCNDYTVANRHFSLVAFLTFWFIYFFKKKLFLNSFPAVLLENSNQKWIKRKISKCPPSYCLFPLSRSAIQNSIQFRCVIEPLPNTYFPFKETWFILEFITH